MRRHTSPCSVTIKDGELKTHLRRLNREYRRRRETLQACLHGAFGEQNTVQEPEGGLDLVVRSGRQFSPFGHAENALRLGFASLDVEEIRQATHRLAQAWSAIGKTRSL